MKDITKKIEELKPEWAEYGDIIIDSDYNGKSAIVIKLNDTKAKGIKSLKGKDIIKFLNESDSDDYDFIDVTYGYDFIFDEEVWDKKSYVLSFDIEYGHYIKDNSIEIFEDGRVEVYLQEPFEGGGESEELQELMEAYLNKINFIKKGTI